jgi:hypothetical protein
MLDKVIIPQNKFSVIAQFENKSINEVGKIGIPYSSKSVFTKNRLFVSLCFGTKYKSRRLKIFDEYGNQLLRKTEYKFDSINFKDNTVYLGGQYKKEKGELFSFIDLTDPKSLLADVDYKMENMELPVKSMEGKSIDDILIRDDTLFLVDNIVFPKFIFIYDINMPNNPKHIGTYKLENNDT